jgi:hypothetical protein
VRLLLAFSCVREGERSRVGVEREGGREGGRERERGREGGRIREKRLLVRRYFGGFHTSLFTMVCAQMSI